MTDRIQDIEDIFIGAECEFDPKGHWIKVDDPPKLYKTLLAWHDSEIAKAKQKKLEVYLRDRLLLTGIVDGDYFVVTVDPAGLLMDTIKISPLADTESKDIDWDRQIELERQINPVTDTDTESNKKGAGNE